MKKIRKSFRFIGVLTLPPRKRSIPCASSRWIYLYFVSQGHQRCFCLRTIGASGGTLLRASDGSLERSRRSRRRLIGGWTTSETWRLHTDGQASSSAQRHADHSGVGRLVRQWLRVQQARRRNTVPNSRRGSSDTERAANADQGSFHPSRTNAKTKFAAKGSSKNRRNKSAKTTAKKPKEEKGKSKALGMPLHGGTK